MAASMLQSLCLALASATLFGCAPQRADDGPDLGTLSDNPLPTDSVYGTPPDPIPTLPPPPATASPTGRDPRLAWTPERQAVWGRMVTENHPGWQHIVSKCNRARTGSPAYGDRGLWCALVFQMSGDVSAARVAWQVAAPLITVPPTNANDVRENFLEDAILFDWLYPALTDTERNSAIAGLNTWANYALAIGTPQYVGGMRTSDSDALVGYYFGLAATDLATRGMPGHVDWLAATQNNGSVLPVGGLVATGVNRNTARNTITEYVVNRSAGGEWMESSDYDQGTVALLALGVAAIRTAVPGSDPFSDLAPFLEAAAAFNAALVTDDLAQGLQWGDTEHPREFATRLFRRVGALGALAGVTQGSLGSAKAMGLLDALGQRYGTIGSSAAEPLNRYYLTYDPWAPRAAWNADATVRADGRGHLIARTNTTMFSVMMVPRTDVDHELLYLTNLQLYRNGEWAVTNPLGYGGPAVEATAANGLVIAGLGAMTTRGPTRFESGNQWWAYTGATSGQFYAPPYYQPPPTFLNQWQRTVVYLQRNGVDHIVTVDWVDAQDPRALPDFNRYRPADQARISASGGLVQWLLHAPRQPNSVGSTWSWTTPGGEPVVVTPVGYTPVATTISEQTLWAGNSAFHASELGYQLRLTPTFTGGSTVLRNVITVGEANPTITSSGNTITIDGVQVIVTPTGVQVIG